MAKHSTQWSSARQKRREQLQRIQQGLREWANGGRPTPPCFDGELSEQIQQAYALYHLEAAKFQRRHLGDSTLPVGDPIEDVREFERGDPRAPTSHEAPAPAPTATPAKPSRREAIEAALAQIESPISPAPIEEVLIANPSAVDPSPSALADSYQPTSSDQALTSEAIRHILTAQHDETAPERRAWLSRRFNELQSSPQPLPMPPRPRGRPPIAPPRQALDLIQAMERQLGRHRQMVLDELDRFEAQMTKRISRLAKMLDSASEDNNGG